MFEMGLGLRGKRGGRPREDGKMRWPSGRGAYPVLAHLQPNSLLQNHKIPILSSGQSRRTTQNQISVRVGVCGRSTLTFLRQMCSVFSDVLDMSSRHPAIRSGNAVKAHLPRIPLCGATGG